MVKNFSEVYVSKEFPDSEPLAKLVGSVFDICRVEYPPSNFALALVTVRFDSGERIYRTTSETLYEQLAFIKNHNEMHNECVRVMLAKKVSHAGREYFAFVSAKK